MRLRAIDLVDVLMYLIVLGTFSQLFPAVISETFLLSLLTAILLKIVLEAVVWVKGRAIAHIRSDGTAARRAVGVVVLLLILPAASSSCWSWWTSCSEMPSSSAGSSW